MSGTRGPYQLKKRAKHQQETRQRIVEATVELHGSVGPSRTTISAIAEKAGVQRLTVYRHFPDEQSLFAACSSHFNDMHPKPDPVSWREIADPETQLRHGLAQVYAYFADTEQMILNVLRDAALVPGMSDSFTRFAGQWAQMRDVLSDGWDMERSARVRLAAIAHALDFTTWHSLRRQHRLNDGEIIDLMSCLVGCASNVQSPEPDQDEVQQQPQHRQPKQNDND